MTELGLTLLEAKVYCALSQTGKATIKTIAKTSSIARQDIYRIMPELQKLGLVEKILAAPTSYKAIPFKEGLSVLLQNRTHEYSELQKKAMDIINNFDDGNDEVTPQEEDSQFIITSSQKLLHKRLGEGHRRAQKSIYAVGGWRSIRKMLYNRFEPFKESLKKGVKIWVITEKHEIDKATRKILLALKDYPLFEIRYLAVPVPVKTVIHDEKEVNMCIAIPPENDVPSIWSSNPQFVKVMTAYFEELWNKAADAMESRPAHDRKLIALPVGSA
ncbi:MAG: hypothetical protein NWE94_00010 [Candidatus Bathyarchaeota archaeon]|nr:hypothetical protein [Candidatus Bathyarchaeota archaeon]